MVLYGYILMSFLKKCSDLLSVLVNLLTCKFSTVFACLGSVTLKGSQQLTCSG